MVFASIRKHAEHCDIFASSSRNKKNLLCKLASNCKNLGSTNKRALVSILRANRAKGKFCEQLKISMDHSSPLLFKESHGDNKRGIKRLTCIFEV